MFHIAFKAKRCKCKHMSPVQKFAPNAILMVLVALRGAICGKKCTCTKPVFRLAACSVAKTISEWLETCKYRRQVEKLHVFIFEWNFAKIPTGPGSGELSWLTFDLSVQMDAFPTSLVKVHSQSCKSLFSLNFCIPSAWAHTNTHSAAGERRIHQIKRWIIDKNWIISIKLYRTNYQHMGYFCANTSQPDRDHRPSLHPLMSEWRSLTEIAPWFWNQKSGCAFSSPHSKMPRGSWFSAGAHDLNMW